MKSSHVLVAAVMIAGSASALPAQSAGRLLGHVVSTQTGDAIPAAQVVIEGTSLGTLTDLNGRYVLGNVPAGSTTVVVQSLGYGTKRVTDVVIETGGTVTLDVTLTPEAIALEGITVTASVERGSSVALLQDRRRSATMVDAIGSEQIARSPDGDAAAALKRVPGVSVVDGKYVHVRGLGGRYGATTLNGATLASPEPDKKVVPLDIIPSDLLESVVTAKTYSPQHPGDHGGGLVQISTRGFPAFRTLNVGVSTSYDSNATFQDGLLYDGGSLDFFGFDDGTRDLPDLIPRNRPVTRSSFAAEQLERIGHGFADGLWGPNARQLPLNTGLDLSFGDEIEVAERPLGFLAAFTHSSSYTAADDQVERVFSSAGAAQPEVDYTGRTGSHEVGFGGLATLGYQLTRTDELRAEVLYNRLVDDEARALEGYNLDSSTDQLNTRIRYLAQSVGNAQLRGRHEIERLLGSTIEWRASYSRAERDEPGTREVLYREFEGQYLWDNFIQSGSIFHQEMAEDGLGGALDVSVPLEVRDLPASLSFGASADLKDRDTYTRRFRFVPAPGATIGEEVRALPPNLLFSAQNIGPSAFELNEATFRSDNYLAEQQVYAGYVLLDAEVLPRLRLAGGARLETTRQAVDPRDLFETGLDPLPGAELETADVLPAINLTYALAETMNLRAGASQTLARPQFRELAPFSFADYAGGYLVSGNPQLTLTRIRNYDLRWEWFFEPRSVVSLSGFYKRFQDPIEVLVYPSSELIKSWVNGDRARTVGLEIELRSSLGVVAPWLNDLSVNANLTWVDSEVETDSVAELFIPNTGPATVAVVPKSRPLQGQSPYVVNLGAIWASDGGGTTASVLYNRFGRRIDAVGGQTLPDIYEEARDQLDLVLEQGLPGGLSATLAASRLLGGEVEFTQGGHLLRGHDLGRTFSLSVSWEAAGN